MLRGQRIQIKGKCEWKTKTKQVEVECNGDEVAKKKKHDLNGKSKKRK